MDNAVTKSFCNAATGLQIFVLFEQFQIGLSGQFFVKDGDTAAAFGTAAKVLEEKSVKL
jgi:hypothetical protein